MKYIAIIMALVASFAVGVYLVRARFDRVGLVSRLSGRGGESISKRVVYLK